MTNNFIMKSFRFTDDMEKKLQQLIKLIDNAHGHLPSQLDIVRMAINELHNKYTKELR